MAIRLRCLLLLRLLLDIVSVRGVSLRLRGGAPRFGVDSHVCCF